MSPIIPPANVIDCVTHPDPYPYYHELVCKRPLYFDETLNAWVASSAEMVKAVLAHPHCAVRPVAAPVPSNLIGSSAGVVFQHLIRMNEGNTHSAGRSAIAAQTEAFSLQRLSEISRYWAETLLNKQNTANLNQFAADLPVYGVADLIGISTDHIKTAVELVQTFALCLNPLNSAEQVEKGKSAAGELMRFFQHTTESRFYSQLTRNTNSEIAAANCIGLMFQAYEATAGWIGNTLHALASFPELREQIIHDETALSAFIAEVSRWNPSVQNTRRYLTDAATIAGQKMCNEDMVIVVLAAANRDHQVNPDPHNFHLQRDNRQSFTFGAGHHACIGERMAFSIVQAATIQILAVGADLGFIPHATTYLPYSNLRLPILKSAQEFAR